MPPFDCPLPLTASVKGAEAEAPSVSAARTSKFAVAPAALAGGVPPNVAPLKLNQEGRPDPVQVNAPVPPDPVNETLYAMPAVAAGSGEVVVMVTGGFTVTDKDCALLPAPSASVTATLKLNVVAVVTGGAVPEIVAILIDNQPGSSMPLKVSGAVPPVAVSVCE